MTKPKTRMITFHIDNEELYKLLKKYTVDNSTTFKRVLNDYIRTLVNYDEKKNNTT